LAGPAEVFNGCSTETERKTLIWHVWVCVWACVKMYLSSFRITPENRRELVRGGVGRGTVNNV